MGTPLNQLVFAGLPMEAFTGSPQEAATLLIQNSKLRDVEERRRIVEGGMAAIGASDDPMIILAWIVDPISREIREHYETRVLAQKAVAYAEIAQRYYEEHGRHRFLDATGTLRLSYGVVRGYVDSHGRDIPPFTYIPGIFVRAEEREFRYPYSLPQNWLDARDTLDPTVPFNFVSTHDIVGGNSGSPVINTRGEVVGTVFDGNIYQLPNSFVYTDEQMRSVSVHVAVVIESLRKIYGATRILEELGL
jgi:hypothetical protein